MCIRDRYRTQNGHITLGMTPVEKLKEIFTPGCMDGYTAEDQMNRRIEFDRIVSEEMKKRTTEEWMELFELSLIHISGLL